MSALFDPTQPFLEVKIFQREGEKYQHYHNGDMTVDPTYSVDEIRRIPIEIQQIMVVGEFCIVEYHELDDGKWLVSREEVYNRFKELIGEAYTRSQWNEESTAKLWGLILNFMKPDERKMYAYLSAKPLHLR